MDVGGTALDPPPIADADPVETVSDHGRADPTSLVGAGLRR
jgi:hypothetical protein